MLLLSLTYNSTERREMKIMSIITMIKEMERIRKEEKKKINKKSMKFAVVEDSRTDVCKEV